MLSFLRSGKLLGILLLFLVSVDLRLMAADVWSRPSFSADAATIRREAVAVKAEKNTDATVLLNDSSYSFDESGKLVEARHLIYRIETLKGLSSWAESSGRWKAWFQSKPEIKARVITSEGTEHWLDPKTLNDVAVHTDEPDMYSDERRYGGPLPAVAVGAIVEEEVVLRDTAPMFAAGIVRRKIFGWAALVHQTHMVISHPLSLPLQYRVHLLPDAKVVKATENGIETITIDQGPLSAYLEQTTNTAPDAMLYPEVEFSTGTSWRKIAAEYARATEDKLKPSEAQELLATINLGKGDRNEKIRRIVAALHKSVRYTGVEFGESSLIPQPPSETLKRKYGDCKDKASLLVSMLRGAGIPANLALLDSGFGQDVNSELPGMGMFDHAIVYVPASGKDAELWIDATAQYSQVGTLPWMDYGRKALVISESAEQLKQIPYYTAEQNVYRQFREFTLSEYGLGRVHTNACTCDIVSRWRSRKRNTVALRSVCRASAAM